MSSVFRRLCKQGGPVDRAIRDSYAVRMRWDALFGDIEAQLAAAGVQDLEAEVAELSRVEQSRLELIDRLRGSVGTELQVMLRESWQFTGTVTHVGLDWMLLAVANRSVLVPVASVVWIAGLGPLALKPAGKIRRTLASALRALAHNRAPVNVHVAAGAGRETALSGFLDGVGADCLELALVPEGESRRARNVAASYSIPFTALLAVSSRAQDNA